MQASILVAPLLGRYHYPFLKNINYFADSLFLAHTEQRNLSFLLPSSYSMSCKFALTNAVVLL